MASVEAIAVTTFLHLILRFLLHLSCDAQIQTTGPKVASDLVGVAILLVIYNNRVLPLRFIDSSIVVKCFIESSIALSILELCMVVWTSVELLIALIVSKTLLGFNIISKKTFSQNESLIIGSFTIPLSVIMLFTVYHINTVRITDDL